MEKVYWTQEVLEERRVARIEKEQSFVNGMGIGIAITYACTGHPVLAGATIVIKYWLNKKFDEMKNS